MSGRPTWVSKSSIGSLMLWALALFCAVRGVQAFAQAPVFPVALGIALLWAAVLVAPPTGVWLRKLSFQSPGAARVALGLIPVFAVAIAIASRPVPGGAEVAARSVEPTPSASVGEAENGDKAIHPAFIRQMLSSHLIDPSSAQLSDVMAFKTGDKLTLCGQVNAKNRMGGYAGPTPFIISDNGTVVGDGVTADRVFQECQGAKVTMVEID